MRSVLLTPRWLAGHLLALALVVLFLNLGFWQLRRLDQRREHVAAVTASAALAPAPLDALVADAKANEHRAAVAAGRFAPEEEVLLRGRSRSGRPGFHVLTPLVIADGPAGGQAVLVERGWVPYELDAVPVEQALPPDGQVTVTGRLRVADGAPEGAWLAPSDPQTGELTQIFYPDAARLEAQMPWRLLPVYLELTAIDPPQRSELPVPLEPPATDEGPHLGYAIQWFSFAAIGVVGYFFLMRRVMRDSGPPRGSPSGSGTA